MSSPTSLPDASKTPPYILAFVVLQVFGCVGMVLILITSLIMYKKKRYVIWISFCMAWIIFSAGYCLLLVSGQQFKSSPASGLCRAQSAISYAAPPLGSSATLSFVLHLLLQVMAIIRQRPVFKTKRVEYIATATLVAMPWVIYFILFIVFLVYGERNPSFVVKHNTDAFCLLDRTVPSTATIRNVTPITTAVTAIPIIIAEIIIAIDICRKKESMKMIALIPLGMVVRVGCFTVATFGVIIFSLIYSFNDTHDNDLNIILSITPALGVLAFGMPRNVFRFRPFSGGGWKWKWQRQSKTLSYLPTVSHSEHDLLHTINLSQP